MRIGERLIEWLGRRFVGMRGLGVYDFRLISCGPVSNLIVLDFSNPVSELTGFDAFAQPEDQKSFRNFRTPG